MAGQDKDTRPTVATAKDAQQADSGPQVTHTTPTATVAVPLPPQVGAMPYEAYRAQQAVEDVIAGRALTMDTTVKGGHYLTEDGRTVDADGKEIKG